MAHPFELAPLLMWTHGICRGEVVGFDDDSGRVLVRTDERGGDTSTLACEVLNPDTAGATLTTGDAVLAWLSDAGVGVVLGRVGPHAATLPVVPEAEFASRPKSLVIEAQGELVLRNGQSRITLGAAGDVEIVCNSFATRSQRLLRLLAPMIKLN